MKKVSLFIQQQLFNFCLSVSKDLKLMYSIGNNKSYSFFYGLGPKILIVREGKLHVLSSAFSVHAEFDDHGKLIYCKPLFMTAKKEDIVFYGKKRVYREYQQKYHSPYEEGVGMTSFN